jgi:hypothetical protein
MPIKSTKPKSKSSDLSAGFGNLPTVKRPVGRPRLSDEERKERLKESNRKYYEKMRLLIKKAKSI